MAEAHLVIEDMHCDACVRGVSNVLKKIEGLSVEGVEIGSAKVMFDEHRTSAEAIAQRLTDAGFPAKST